VSGGRDDSPSVLFRAGDASGLGFAIARRAEAAGVGLGERAARALALQAIRVRERNDELSLTAIRDPEEFLERHLGESFEGAAMLPEEMEGLLLDLGSGNGYPGLPVAAARPGLSPLLVEASARKTAFLREVVAEAFPGAAVLHRQVQRPADLEDVGPLRVLVTRAAGAWDRVLPRLAPALDPQGTMLVWAGVHMETVLDRSAWRRYRLIERKPLPGRDRSWVWRFRVA
jgi:16S rRNA (guanine527-N7)-methyltransferase